MSRSTTAKMAAAKHKKRPPSVLHPNDRRTRNMDQRGKDFLAWVRTLRCCTGECIRWGQLDVHPTEAAHIGGGFAGKASNWRVIPLCSYHHNGASPFSEHKLKRNFGRHHGIDVEQKIASLRAEFDRLYPPGGQE